jgi:hypothetical protein
MRHTIIRTPWLFAAIILFAGAASTSPAASVEEIEAKNSIAIDYQAPHTKWGRPLAAGPMRVLFLMKLHSNVNAAASRDAVEMVARFDLEADAVLVMPAQGNAYAVAFRGESGVFGGELGEERLARLLQTPYDCYVINDSDVAAHLPASSLQTILDHVRQGAGLLLPDREIFPAMNEVLKLEVESVGQMPSSLADSAADAFRFEKGRILNCDLPYHNPSVDLASCEIFGVHLRRDLYFEAFGRSLFWTAAREPRVNLTVTPDQPNIPRTELAEHCVEVSWDGKPVGDGLELKARLRSLTRYGSLDGGAFPLEPAPGQNESARKVRYTLPRLPSGDYIVEVIARTNRGVEAWAVDTFDVKSTERLSSPELKSRWGEPGEPIVGTIAVDSPYRDKRTLRMQVIDRHGRALARQDYRAPGEEVQFSLTTDSSMPGYLAVEAVLLSEEEPVVYAYETYTNVQRGHRDFNFIMWGRLYAMRYLDLAEQLLRRCGITSRLETSEVPWTSMTRAGMTYTPYCTSGLQRQEWQTAKKDHRGRRNLIKLNSKGVLIGNGNGRCWNDEPTVTRNLRQWMEAQRDVRSHGVLAYSMGDEHETIGSCLHPACLKAYRLYLERQYGTIRRLNASWETTFSDFGQVELSEAGDNCEKQAFAQGNYPRWFDRRAFQAWNFANYVGRFGRAAQEIDPQAKWGVEGTGWLDDDLDAIVRNSNWWVPYSIPASEVIRSVAPRDYLLGHFVGYSDTNPYYSLSDFWMSFLRGGNCIAWWRVDNFLAPNFGLSEGSKELVRSAKIVFEGLGKLLNVKSRIQHDGIVMLHSYASSQAASHIDPGPSYGTYTGWVTNCETELDKRGPDHLVDWALKPRGKNHMVWHRAIRALGLQFEYATDRMLRRGEFQGDQYKVIILSQCEALGPRESEVIRQFVHNGGTVIADVRPGLYDGHCKPLSGGYLDDLFGVHHTGNVESVEADGTISGLVGKASVDVKLPSLHVNPAIELTSGKALGQAGTTPLMIVNRFGQGRAMLLNFTMVSFPNLSLPETPEADAQMLAAIFDSSGVRWPLRLKNPDGTRLRDVEAVRWKTGDAAEVVAVYGPLNDGRHQWRPREGHVRRARERDVPRPVRIELPEAKYVTQIGTGEAFGQTKTVSIVIRPWRPTFLVLSDRALNSPALEPTSATVHQGETLNLRAQVPGATGLHALKVRVTTPAGEPSAWFDRTVITDSHGSTNFSLKIAFNELPGAWKVELSDLYTGKSTVTDLQIVR